MTFPKGAWKTHIPQDKHKSLLFFLYQTEALGKNLKGLAN